MKKDKTRSMFDYFRMQRLFRFMQRRRQSSAIRIHGIWLTVGSGSGHYQFHICKRYEYRRPMVV